MPINVADFNRAILNGHNDLRSQVALGNVADQPSASNMGRLHHSCALADIATTYAEQMCLETGLPPHNPAISNMPIATAMGHMNDGTNSFDISPGCMKTQQNTITFGENLSVQPSGMTAEDIAAALLQEWWEEHLQYNYHSKTCSGTSVDANDDCLHYTQIVEALTDYTGCGFSECAPGSPRGEKTVVVCNYFQQGNFNALKNYPYLSGDAGSQCGEMQADQAQFYPNMAHRGNSHSNGLCDGCLHRHHCSNPNAVCPNTCDASKQEEAAFDCAGSGGGLGSSGNADDGCPDDIPDETHPPMDPDVTLSPLPSGETHPPTDPGWGGGEPTLPSTDPPDDSSGRSSQLELPSSESPFTVYNIMNLYFGASILGLIVWFFHELRRCLTPCRHCGAAPAVQPVAVCLPRGCRQKGARRKGPRRSKQNGRSFRV